MTIMYCPDCESYADCKSSKNKNVIWKDGERYIPIRETDDPFASPAYQGDVFWHERTRKCNLCDHERRTVELDYDKLCLLMEENKRLRDVFDTIFSLIEGVPEHG